MRSFLLLIWVCFITSFSVVFAEDLLTVNDIQPVMKQIFEQHVDQKEISNKSIKSAFKVYIDKFDPERIYLLEEEVSPYLQLTDSQLNSIVSAYKQNNFSAFENLNRMIQNAILRSRLMRSEIENSPGALFSASSAAMQDGTDPDLKKDFPKNKAALQSTIRNYLVNFINAEKRHFGSNVVLSNQAQTIVIFEKGMQQRENNYLYLNPDGRPMSKAEQDNLFTIHVLKALASSLDAHTTFYDENEATELKTRLQKEFQGVGIIFQQKIDGTVLVGDLSDGGPAAKSGMVKIGDTVQEVNGISIIGVPFDKVMEMVRSSKGPNDTLQLTLKRKTNGQIVKVQLKKQEIAVKGERAEGSFRRINDGIIGLITLNSFYQNPNGITSEHDVLAALERFRKIGTLRGLILDLRENSGGFLNQAVKVAGLFISNGVIVVSKYFNGEEHYYRDLDGKTYYSGPFVILTSRATASAAEIVAQALQDYGVAIVVGDETTYGKGTIQNQNVTDDNPKGTSLFKVTVGKYYTVSGKTPQLQGVKADIVVPGIFNYEHLGEQYLEFTVQNDTIQNEYTDDLADVTPNLKAWYQRYYMPTLQHKNQFWQKMLPALRERSAERLMQNQDYQIFLKNARNGHPYNYNKNNSTDDKHVDYQLDEAVNIVQDMIRLELQERGKSVVNEKSVAEKSEIS
jgi:carboxyl-terminal processing protease